MKAPIQQPLSVTMAFVVFTVFYVICLAVTWAVYLRPGSEMAKEHV